MPRPYLPGVAAELARERGRIATLVRAAPLAPDTIQGARQRYLLEIVARAIEAGQTTWEGADPWAGFEAPPRAAKEAP